MNFLIPCENGYIPSNRISESARLHQVRTQQIGHHSSLFQGYGKIRRQELAQPTLCMRSKIKAFYRSAAPITFHSRMRPKYLLFALIGLVVAYVLGHNERFLIDSRDPEWPHFQSFKWWLLSHGLSAACALFLGSMPFSDRLRQRFTRLHRVVGQFYVAGAFIAEPLGFYIQYFEERTGGTRSFSVAVADAFLWMVTTPLPWPSFLWARSV